MSFSSDYYYYYPRFLDRRGLYKQYRPRSDVTLHILCSGTTLLYTNPAKFRQIIWVYNDLVKKIEQWCKEKSGIPGLFLKQLPLG